MKEDPEGLCKQPVDEMNHEPQINAKTFTNCTNFFFPPAVVPVAVRVPVGKIWRGTCA